MRSRAAALSRPVPAAVRRLTVMAPVLMAPVLALALAACGSSSLSATQLRTAAAQVCTVAAQGTAQIPSPASPGDVGRYLSRGVAALAPEAARLAALHPPGDLAGPYGTAVDAAGAEVRELRTTVKALKTGGDPVVEIKSLQRKLATLEARADDAWKTLGIDACLTR